MRVIQVKFDMKRSKSLSGARQKFSAFSGFAEMNGSSLDLPSNREAR